MHHAATCFGVIGDRGKKTHRTESKDVDRHARHDVIDVEGHRRQSMEQAERCPTQDPEHDSVPGAVEPATPGGEPGPGNHHAFQTYVDHTGPL